VVLSRDRGASANPKRIERRTSPSVMVALIR
jgi:hypothetical protein